MASRLLFSAALHSLILFAYCEGARPPPPQRAIDFDVVEVQPPPPPPPPPPEVPRAEKPQPHPVIVKRAPEVKPPEPPPPPNAPPPPTPAAPPPIRIGVSLESTTAAGGMAVPTGNTLYGKADEVAGDPNDAQGYAATETKKDAIIPSSQLTTLPKVLREPPHEYPDEARKAGIEGSVQIRVTIDASGNVIAVKILEGPGHGLEEAARRAIFKSLWAPGKQQGRAVATTIPYTFRFRLEDP